MKKITWIKTFGSIFSLFVLILLSQSINAQCPTVVNANQTFCDIDSPQISDLVATDNGGGINWYLTSTGGSPISTNTPLQNGITYFADDDAETCVPRPSVTVSIFGGPPTDVDVAVSRCSSDTNTIAQLSVDGINIQWFDAQFNGNLLSLTDPLVNGVTYWVQQTENGCVSRRLPTTVTIIDPGAPTGDNEQFFCIDPSNPVVFTIADLVANGTDITWYDTATSNIPLDLTTPLIDNEDYFATQTSFPCESQDRFSTIVRFDDAVDAGENGTLSVCEDETNTFNLFDELTGTPDNGGAWTGPVILTNGDQGTLDVSLLGAGSFVFTYTVVGQNACPDEIATVTVTVQAQPDAGIDGVVDLCSVDPAVDLFTLLGGTPDTGGVWSPALASGTGIFDPAVDAAGVYTYTVSPTAPCTTPDSSQVTVNVEQAPFAGNNSAATLCENDPPIDLFTLLGGTPDPGGVWSPALASGTGVFDPAVDAAQVYTYTLAATALCPEDTATVTVTLETPPDAGIDGAILLCSNDDPVDLFTFLGGTPDTGGVWSPALASGTGIFDPAVDTAQVYTYTVTGTGVCADDTATVDVTIEQAPDPGTNGNALFCENDPPIDLFSLLGGTPDTGGTWSGPSTLTNGDLGTFDPATNTAGTYTYSLAATATCNGDSATVTITLETPPDAGIDANASICSNDDPVDLFTFLGGTPDTGGVWSPALASGTGVFDPAVDTAQVYTYTVTGANQCADDSATVDVTIEQAPDPGTNGNALFCENDPPIDLFSLLGGTPDTGGTWSGPSTLTNGDLGTFNPATNTAGTYTYTLAATATCTEDSATVTITLETPPNAGVDATIDLCTNNDPIDLFTILGGTPDAGGVWSPALASGTGVFDPAVDTAQIYTYTVSGANQCADDSATVNVTLFVAPNAGVDTSLTICGDDTAVDLFSLLGTGVDTGGTWSGPSTLANGDLGTFDPAVNISGAYIYTVTGPGVCEDTQATVTVTIVDPNPTLADGGDIFCAVDNPTVADLITNIIPENGGTIDVYDSITGGTALDPTLPLVDNTTYFITETDTDSGCESTVRLAVTITISDPSTPTLSQTSAAFCLIDLPTVGDLTSFVTSGGTILWFDTANGGNQLNNSDPLVTGSYFAALEDTNGCTSTVRVEISVVVNNNPTPTLNTDGNQFCGVDRPTLTELEANLNFDSSLRIVWFDQEEGGNVLDISTLLISETTYFAATFNDVTGCESLDRLPITVDLTICDPAVFSLFIPDAFSPNGDAINDTYSLVDIEFLFPNYTIEIYNRYGNIVYKGDINTPPWDGTSIESRTIGNNTLPNGVYFYILNFNRNDMPAEQGRIYLNR